MGKRSRSVIQRRAERAERRRINEDRAADGRRRGCLFCRRSDGGFATLEHIVPESLGNEGLILPNGVVCDRCNNGPLSVLDQALCDFLPVKARQVMLGVSTKSGRVPVLRFAGGTMTHAVPNDVVINTAGSRPTLRETGHVGDRVQLEMNLAGGRRLTSRYASELSRALLKAALEAAWLDHGDRMLDSAFDHAREAVLGAPRDGFFAAGHRGDPDHLQIDLHYNIRQPVDGSEGMPVVCVIFGNSLATDSLCPLPVVAVDAQDVHMVTFTRKDFKRRRAA